LGQIYNQESAIVHRICQIELRRDLTEDKSQVWRCRKLPRLIQNGRDSFRLKVLRVPRKLLVPKPQRLRIGDTAQQSLAEAIVGVDAWEIDEARVSARQKGYNTVVQQVLGAGSPAVRPEVLERCHDAGRRARPTLRDDSCRRIEAHRTGRVGRVEIA